MSSANQIPLSEFIDSPINLDAALAACAREAADRALLDLAGSQPLTLEMLGPERFESFYDDPETGKPTIAPACRKRMAAETVELCMELDRLGRRKAASAVASCGVLHLRVRECPADPQHHVVVAAARCRHWACPRCGNGHGRLAEFVRRRPEWQKSLLMNHSGYYLVLGKTWGTAAKGPEERVARQKDIRARWARLRGKLAGEQPASWQEVGVLVADGLDLEGYRAELRVVLAGAEGINAAHLRALWQEVGGTHASVRGYDVEGSREVMVAALDGLAGAQALPGATRAAWTEAFWGHRMVTAAGAWRGMEMEGWDGNEWVGPEGGEEDAVPLTEAEMAAWGGNSPLQLPANLGGADPHACDPRHTCMECQRKLAPARQHTILPIETYYQRHHHVIIAGTFGAGSYIRTAGSGQGQGRAAGAGDEGINPNVWGGIGLESVRAAAGGAAGGVELPS